MDDNSLEGDGLKLAESFPMAYVSLTVSNLEKSLEFYQSVIGLSVLLNTDRIAVLGALDGRPLVLLTEEKQAIPSAPDATGPCRQRHHVDYSNAREPPGFD